MAFPAHFSPAEAGEGNASSSVAQANGNDRVQMHDMAGSFVKNKN
jgi:hypothetical protein